MSNRISLSQFYVIESKDTRKGVPDDNPGSFADSLVLRESSMALALALTFASLVPQPGRQSCTVAPAAGHPAAVVRRLPARALARMSADELPFAERIAKLEAAIRDLEACRIDDETLRPLKEELKELKIADLEDRLNALRLPNPGQNPAEAEQGTAELEKSLFDLCAEIEESALALQAPGAKITDYAWDRLTALRARRTDQLGLLLETDGKAYTKTLARLREMHSIPESDLPKGRRSTADAQQTPLSSMPSTPTPSPPTPPGDEVVTIGGKRYVIKSAERRRIDPKYEADASTAAAAPTPPASTGGLMSSLARMLEQQRADSAERTARAKEEAAQRVAAAKAAAKVQREAAAQAEAEREIEAATRRTEAREQLDAAVRAARAGAAEAKYFEASLRLGVSIESARSAGVPYTELAAAVELENELEAAGRRAKARADLEEAVANVSAARYNERGLRELRLVIDEARRCEGTALSGA